MRKLYVLKNNKTRLYFQGYSKDIPNKPLWTKKSADAAAYKKSEANRMLKRLDVQYAPYQKITIKEVRRPGVKELKKSLWKIVSQYVRLRDALETTGTKDKLRCCTCGALIPAFGPDGAQAGHFVAGRNNAVLFDERGIHGQCKRCNLFRGGEPLLYRRFMVRKYGEKVAEEMINKRYETVMYTASDLENLIEEYTEKLNELKER